MTARITAGAKPSVSGTIWPGGVRKLKGYDDMFRLRVGDYRVIYSVDDTRLIVILLKVGHRGDIYR